MAPVSEPAARRPGGRANQKERTRQALLAATRTLLADGQAPTIARAAERALVSEATAYRYYSDVQNLLRDAFQWPGLDGLLSELRAIPTVEARARRRRRGDDAPRSRQAGADPGADCDVLRAWRSGEGKRDPAGFPAPADRCGSRTGRGSIGRRRAPSAAIRPVRGHRRRSGAEFEGRGRRCTDEEIVATLGWTAFQLAKAALGPSPTAGERA